MYQPARNILSATLLADEGSPPQQKPAPCPPRDIDTNSTPILTGRARVSPVGQVLIQGLAESKRFTLTTGYSRQANVPFYLSLNHATEAIFGWLAFQRNALARSPALCLGEGGFCVSHPAGSGCRVAGFLGLQPEPELPGFCGVLWCPVLLLCC